MPKEFCMYHGTNQAAAMPGAGVTCNDRRCCIIFQILGQVHSLVPSTCFGRGNALHTDNQNHSATLTHLGLMVVVALGGPHAHHCGPCSRKGGVQLLHGITEVLAVADSVAAAKASNGLACQVELCMQYNVVNISAVHSWNGRWCKQGQQRHRIKSRQAEMCVQHMCKQRL